MKKTERENISRRNREEDERKALDGDLLDGFQKINIEDTNDCEYDVDNHECLATGCSRYGLCYYTK